MKTSEELANPGLPGKQPLKLDGGGGNGGANIVKLF